MQGLGLPKIWGSTVRVYIGVRLFMEATTYHISGYDRTMYRIVADRFLFGLREKRD